MQFAAVMLAPNGTVALPNMQLGFEQRRVARSGLCVLTRHSGAVSPCPKRQLDMFDIV